MCYVSRLNVEIQTTINPPKKYLTSNLGTFVNLLSCRYRCVRLGRCPNIEVPLFSSINILSSKLFPEMSRTCKDVMLLNVPENKKCNKLI